MHKATFNSITDALIFYSLRDIETALEDQRDAHSELKTLMTRKDEQSSLEINELTREVNEKINNERRLSEQLEIHQKNFDSLKNELSQVSTLGNSCKVLLRMFSTLGYTLCCEEL